MHGFFGASIKFPANYTAGVVVAFNMLNGDMFETNQYEIDFEGLFQVSNVASELEVVLGVIKSHGRTLIGKGGVSPANKHLHTLGVLNIPTKINKGTVEIVTHVELIKKGDKVGSSEAALLSKLGIRPFSYGLVVVSVYDNGSVFSPEVLDLSEDDMFQKFASGLSMVTSLSLVVSYTTLAASPHMFINAYKNTLAVAVSTDYSFPVADQVKEYLKDPIKFVVAVADSGVAQQEKVLGPADDE